MSALVVGTLFAKRYRIGALLGEGGMGSIHEAIDETTARTVAVKLIAQNIRGRDVFVQRFQREAEIAASIRSPHIAELHATGVDDETGIPYIVMERLVGEDVGALLARVPILPVAVALRIAAQACDGLALAHAAGVIHRDIKPSNLFLARGAGGAIDVKLLDFGIAKVRTTLAEPALTQSGAVLGSPLYMSPEQARGDGDLDHRSDLWSLGIVLYQMLSGRTPQQDQNALGSMIVAICTVPAAPVQDAAPWVPRDVALLLRALLALRREDRLASARDLGASLDRLAAAVPALHDALLVPIGEAERNAIAERAAPLEDTTVGESPRRRRETPLPNRRILVIEDNKLNMDMLARRLEKKGYAVIRATTGEAGLALAHAERPDLILMDLGLPGIDGWTTTRTLREAEETRATPIIALTALASSDDRERAREAGCDDYESKPVDFVRLLAKIEALLR